MESLPAWAVRTQAKEELQDQEDGYRSHRNQRARAFGGLRARQAIRAERIREINAADVVMDDGNPTILGEHWRGAWLTVAAYLYVEGRFGEVKTPEEWLAEKVLA